MRRKILRVNFNFHILKSSYDLLSICKKRIVGHILSYNVKKFQINTNKINKK